MQIAPSAAYVSSCAVDVARAKEYLDALYAGCRVTLPIAAGLVIVTAHVSERWWRGPVT
jgi:hypothetical protein